MKSTGEVMGVGDDFAQAFAKAQFAAGVVFPKPGRAFISVRDADKKAAVEVAKRIIELGFDIVATEGTAKALQSAGITCARVNKVNEGRPHIVDMIKNDEIHFIVNTTEGKQAITDSRTIRSNALQSKVMYTTTIAGARATCLAMQLGEISTINRLQDLHKELHS
jgi:carbamoyl-phosphate synthase large subunit